MHLEEHFRTTIKNVSVIIAIVFVAIFLLIVFCMAEDYAPG
jgi:hypothetical protein